MVPVIIIRTFQLMVDGMCESGMIPAQRKRTAVARTNHTLFYEKSVISTYMAANAVIASIFNVCRLLSLWFLSKKGRRNRDVFA